MPIAMRDMTARRRRGIDQLSIRAKLALVSMLVVLALASIPSISLYRDDAIRRINDARLEVLALDNMVLALQRSQNDFINTFDPVYRDDFSQTFETFVENTETLKAHFWDLGLPIDTLERLVVLTSEYQYQFEVMAFTLTDIGQNDREGYRRALGDNFDALGDIIAALPGNAVRSELNHQIAMMRLSAQWLLAGRAEDAIGTFIFHANIVEDVVRDDVADPQTRRVLIDTLERTRQAFITLNEAVVKVGLSYDEGVLGEIGDIVMQAKRVVRELNTQVETAITERERQLNIAIGAMAAFFALAFLFAVVVLWRSISGPVRDVTSIMTRLADGELSVEIPSDPRRDEIGDMFRALRVFKMGAIIRRRTQEELRDAHAKLEQRVEERTAELSAEVAERRRIQGDLEQARELAETANQAKSMFLANMSHELRTPLNAIIGYAEMLKEDALDEGDRPLAEDLDKIHGAGKHLLGVINEILDLSKIEAGRVELNIETFPVADIIETVTGTVRPLVAVNNNTLAVAADGDLGIMESDMMRVRQVLFNFLSNASKFTRDGTVTLGVERISPNPVDGGDDTLVFTISDTGIGMSAEELSRIFDPFTQADTSTTRKYGGTGLGLTVSRELVHLLGGEVDVESAPGEGTTFTVRLPARTAQPETEPEK